MSSNEEQLTMSLKVWHIPYKTVRQKCYTWGELETWLKKCFGEGHFTLNPGETGYVISAPKEVDLVRYIYRTTVLPRRGALTNLNLFTTPNSLTNLTRRHESHTE